MSTPRQITTTLVIDTEKINRGLRRMVEGIRQALQPFAEAMAGAARALGRLAERMREAANDPVYVAGLEARYYVRAGLDPSYAHPERRDALIQGLLAGKTGAADDDLLPFVSPENRRLLAVSALRGWVESYESDRERVYVAHRLWGSARVEVCAA
jgi:hypothetical protein